MLRIDAKIMIVDDMSMIRKAIKKFLNGLGYAHIIEAHKGDVAIDKYKSDKPDFIFMDIVMPDVTGDQALKIIREGGDQQTPIVMLTSIADESMIRRCENLGILGYLLKPLTIDTGPQKLKSMLDKV